MNATKRWIGLVVFIAVCLGAGSLGAIATTPEIDGWYKTLVKPTWKGHRPMLTAMQPHRDQIRDVVPIARE